MKRSIWCRRLPGAIIIAGCLCMATVGQAVEETQRFLDALRERGMYDRALEYIEQMRTSTLADQDFKTVIDYEAGTTLINAARSGQVTAVRQRQLDQAHEGLKKFLAEHPQHPLAAGANTKLADVLVERGRIKTEQAEKPNRPAKEKTQLMQEARTLYTEAEKVLGELENGFLDAHRKFDKVIDPKNTELIEAREQVRRDLIQARLALAAVAYEISRTYPAGGQEKKDALNTAAEKYGDLYTKYGAYLGGLYARIHEARCYKELGDTKKAVGALEDLLTQPNEPQAFREMKNKALVMLFETTVATKDKAQYEKAIAKYQEWEESARGAEESSQDGLAIKFHSGKTFFENAALQKKKADRQANLTEARKLFKFVAARPGGLQSQAKAMLWRKELAGEDAEIPEPANFAEARDRGKDALDRMRAPGLPPEEVAKFRNEAIEYFRLAMAMKTPEVTAKDMNVIRYFLTYLYWTAGDLYEAAVVGEFLARRYSEAPGAGQAAKIAMAAYVKLFNEAKKDPSGDYEFESRRMTGIAKYITQRWAGEPEADDAWIMLISTALNSGQLDQAQKYREGIPEKSPRRADADLMIGQKLWSNYLQASTKQESLRPPQSELDEMIAGAQKTLEEGIARMRKSLDSGGEISYATVASVLSMAQISIGAGQPEKAIQWLEDPKIGALTLVAGNHPATDRGKLREETYKVALRAYVAGQQLEKAEDVMAALEKLIQQAGDSGADASGKLTRIYISLGHELQEQLERLRNERNNEQLEKVSGAFELFLDRIRGRQQGNTFNSLNWVAETFYGLGAGFDLGGSKLPTKAENYYNKAVETYRDILLKCENKQLECPPGAATSINIRLARCLRRLRQHPQARDLLVAVLKEHNTMIDAQLEAAYNYQDWGEDKSAGYTLAMRGSKQHKEIWGWGMIAKRVASNKKYRSVFHEARYNLTLCRFKLAMTKAGTEKKALLQQAKKDILIIQRLYPVMGGDRWMPKYDELLKKIQRLLGEQPVGLKATARK